MGFILGIIGAILAGLGLASKTKGPSGSLETGGKYNVNSWRDLAARMAGDIPVPFILKWIEMESGGNPCSTAGWLTKDGIVGESGISQLFYPDDFVRLKVDINQIRAACKGGAQSTSQVVIRPLTGDELNLQMISMIDYINYARSRASTRLSEVGARWNSRSPDFWKMTKLIHALPEIARKGLVEGTKLFGKPPNNWREFAMMVNKVNVPNWILKGTNNGMKIYYTQQRIRELMAASDRCGSAVERVSV